MIPKPRKIRRPHQIEMLLWALICNAYPAAAKRYIAAPALQQIHLVITSDQGAYQKHLLNDGNYREFICLLWEEMAYDKPVMARLLQQFTRINRRVKIFVGLRVEIPVLEFTQRDRDYLRGERISSD